MDLQHLHDLGVGKCTWKHSHGWDLCGVIFLHDHPNYRFCGPQGYLQYRFQKHKICMISTGYKMGQTNKVTNGVRYNPFFNGLVNGFAWDYFTPFQWSYFTLLISADFVGTRGFQLPG